MSQMRCFRQPLQNWPALLSTSFIFVVSVSVSFICYCNHNLKRLCLSNDCQVTNFCYVLHYVVSYCLCNKHNLKRLCLSNDCQRLLGYES